MNTLFKGKITHGTQTVLSQQFVGTFTAEGDRIVLNLMEEFDTDEIAGIVSEMINKFTENPTQYTNIHDTESGFGVEFKEGV